MIMNDHPGAPTTTHRPGPERVDPFDSPPVADHSSITDLRARVDAIDDRIVRLYRDTLGTEITDVSFFAAGQDRGPKLGACATGEILSTSTRINDVVALDGEAKIDCDKSYVDENGVDQRVTVTGDVTFEQCH